MNAWREYVRTGDWSVGAAVAWKIAVSEAEQQQYSDVAPLHLLIGLCSISKMLGGPAAQDFGLRKEAAIGLQTECKALSSLFANCGLNEATIRRAARGAMAGGQRSSGSVGQRSPFDGIELVREYAIKLAHNEVAGVTHLLASLLEFDGSSVPAFFSECRVDVAKLDAAVRNALSFPLSLSRYSDEELASVTLPKASAPSVATPDERFEVTQAIAIDLRTNWSPASLEDGTKNRLELLCELPLQFGEQPCVETLLQMIVERLTTVIPGAVRGALLLCDGASGNLLLKAHLPPGRPAVSLTLAKRAIDQRQGFIWLQGQDVNASLRELSSMTGMYAPLVWHKDVLGVVCVDNPHRGQPFSDEDLRLLLAVARYAALAVANLRLQQESQENALLLGRLMTSFSPNLRERLLTKARRGKLRLGGDKSEVTILCADIRGFTRLSEAMDAQEVMDLLNSYFPVLVDAIFRFNGTVDKYVGDSILAVFGSPEADSAQYENAIRTAADMQLAMSATNAERKKRGLTTCEIGIGIHCGEVLHGFIGSPERMEFTVIGDVVNKATRYCDAAKANEILISPKVHEYTWRMMQADPVSVTTKHEGNLPAYRVASVRATAASAV